MRTNYLCYTWILKYIWISTLELGGALSSKCPQLDQEKENTLNFNLRNISIVNSDIVHIHSSDNLISKCNILKLCHDYYTDKYKTSMHTHKATNETTVAVTMFQVTKNERGNSTIEWHIIYNKEVILEKCYTYIFSQDKNVTNATKIVNDGLNITCTFNQALPQIISCQASIYFETEKKTSRRLIKNILLKMIKSVCSFLLPKTNLSQGRTNMTLKSFSNLSYFEEIREFGTIDVLPLNSNNSYLELRECALNVQENEEFTCKCEHNKNIIFEFSLFWPFKDRSDNVQLIKLNFTSVKVEVKEMIEELSHDEKYMNVGSVEVVLLSITLAGVLSYFVIWKRIFKGFIKRFLQFDKKSHFKDNYEEEVNNSVIYNLDLISKYGKS